MRIDKMIRNAKANKVDLLVAGRTTKQGVPISCVVRTYNRTTGELLCEVQSSNDGKYILLGTRNSANKVIAIDPDQKFNIAAQDNVI